MAVNFCGNCGNRLEAGEKFCPKCGNKIEERPERPVYPPPYQQPIPQYQQPPYAYTAPEPKQSPALAIVAFVMTFVIAPVGLILGIIGLVKYKKGSRGLCIAATAVSAFFTFIQILTALIIIPAAIGYTSASRRASANSTARSIQYTVDSFLVGADNSGYGMKDGNIQRFDIIVKNGEWTVSAANPANFNSTDTVRWGSEPEDRRGENSNYETDGETLIAESLKDRLPDIKRAAIHIVLKDGNCTAAAFLNDTTKKLEEGNNYPPIKTNGCFTDAIAWQRNLPSNVGLAPLSSSNISYSQII